MTFLGSDATWLRTVHFWQLFFPGMPDRTNQLVGLGLKNLFLGGEQVSGSAHHYNLAEKESVQCSLIRQNTLERGLPRLN